MVNFVAEFNTAAYELYKEELSLCLQNIERKTVIQCGMSEVADRDHNVVEVILKITPISDCPFKAPITINCYNTTCKILVNGPGVHSFIPTHKQLVDNLPNETDLNNLN